MSRSGPGQASRRPRRPPLNPTTSSGTRRDSQNTFAISFSTNSAKAAHDLQPLVVQHHLKYQKLMFRYQQVPADTERGRAVLLHFLQLLKRCNRTKLSMRGIAQERRDMCQTTCVGISRCKSERAKYFQLVREYLHMRQSMHQNKHPEHKRYFNQFFSQKSILSC